MNLPQYTDEILEQFFMSVVVFRIFSHECLLGDTSGALSGARLAFAGRAPINARPGRPCAAERAQPGSVKRGETFMYRHPYNIVAVFTI